MRIAKGMYLIFVLLAICGASFAYAVLNGLEGEYQESVFLFGIGYLVLAQVMFVYRIFRYPDSKKKSEVEDDSDVAEENE
jgi:hypothetical protein